MNNVAVALGSNVGDRAAHVDFAVRRLATALSNLKVSSLHETDPVDVDPQAAFLNGAVVGTTALSARDVLDVLLRIERERGRERPYPGAPRTLDLDLILYGQHVIHEHGLTIPHPRFRQRMFVLAPLSEVAGDWRDPVSGRTIAELLDVLRS